MSSSKLRWFTPQRSISSSISSSAIATERRRIPGRILLVEFEEQILANINELIIPYVEKLKRHTSEEKARAYIGILEANVNEITTPFGSHLSSKFSKLTPTELEVAKLIIQGNTTKKIADILNTASSTVDFHRNNIRKKIGISNAQINLRTYLTSLH